MNSKAKKFVHDVLSVPFDPDELRSRRSRVRSQLRNPHWARQIRERLRFAEELEPTRENHRTATLGRRGDPGCPSVEGR